MTLETNKNLILNNKNNDSPQVVLVDGDSKRLLLQKLDSGEARILNDQGNICLLSSNNQDQYICFVTTNNQPNLMWHGIADDGKTEPGVRVDSNGKLQYRHAGGDWVYFDTLQTLILGHYHIQYPPRLGYASCYLQ